MKPTYEVSVDFVVDGVAACLRNAERLARAAERLLPTVPALALSVGVLSLEEVGKLLFVDGLLIAARDDYKTDTFREGQKKHRSKLWSLIRYLWALDWFASLDPQRKANPVFLRMVHKKKVQWNEARKALAPWLGLDAALDGLDSWKQKGFYADFSGGKVTEPEDAVSTGFAGGVVGLAALTVDVLLFLFDGNLEHYREKAVGMRGSLKQVDRKALRDAAAVLVSDKLQAVRRRNP